MRRHLGVGRVVAEGREEELGEAHPRRIAGAAPRTRQARSGDETCPCRAGARRRRARASGRRRRRAVGAPSRARPRASSRRAHPERLAAVGRGEPASIADRRQLAADASRPPARTPAPPRGRRREGGRGGCAGPRGRPAPAPDAAPAPERLVRRRPMGGAPRAAACDRATHRVGTAHPRGPDPDWRATLGMSTRWAATSTAAYRPVNVGDHALGRPAATYHGRPRRPVSRGAPSARDANGSVHRWMA